MDIFWLTNSVLWKKEFLTINSYTFDEKLQAAQEWEFHSRIMFNHNQYLAINKALVYNRKHNDSISYNDAIEKRRYHYLKAREKMALFLKKNKINSDYLNSYLLISFKYYLRKRNYRIPFRIYFNHIVFS